MEDNRSLSDSQRTYRSDLILSFLGSLNSSVVLYAPACHALSIQCNMYICTITDFSSSTPFTAFLERSLDLLSRAKQATINGGNYFPLQRECLYKISSAARPQTN